MNPVLRKDLIVMLRLRRVAAIQVAYVAVLGILVMMTWPQAGVLPSSTQVQDDLMLALLLGQFILFILFIPGLMATSIAAERETNTFELLYISHLSAFQILVGKLLSALVLPMLLLLEAAPFVVLLC